MPMKKPDDEMLFKLHAVLLEMLAEVDRICRKNGIEYTISGGTLLGAVRHGGFIPWDDDVDISMRRKDYNKFCEACKAELDTERFFFQDHTTDPEYWWGYGRLRRKNSKFIRKGQEHMKMKTGIFLDIFPNDYIPDFFLLKFFHAFVCFVIRKLLYSESGKVSAESSLLRLLYRGLNFIPRNMTFAVYERLTKIEPSEYCRAITFPSPKGNRNFGSPSVYYEEYIDIQFAGLKLRAIKQYKKYLEYKYGDYMILPPLEKRHWHPACLIQLPEENRIERKFENE